MIEHFRWSTEEYDSDIFCVWNHRYFDAFTPGSGQEFELIDWVENQITIYDATYTKSRTLPSNIFLA